MRVLIWLIANFAALACVIFAGVMALHHIGGWGWFLFVALLAQVSLETKKVVSK